MKPIVIKQIRTTDPEYTAMVALRDEVLRQPLGLSIKNDDLSKDLDTILFIAQEGERTVGCVILKPLDNRTAKLRAMAVTAEKRGSGIGALLVGELERFAAANGFETVEMNARMVAKGFYERLGYQAEGDEFIEVTVPHVLMKKSLV